MVSAATHSDDHSDIEFRFVLHEIIPLSCIDIYNIFRRAALIFSCEIKQILVFVLLLHLLAFLYGRRRHTYHRGYYRLCVFSMLEGHNSMIGQKLQVVVETFRTYILQKGWSIVLEREI